MKKLNTFLYITAINLVLANAAFCDHKTTNKVPLDRSSSRAPDIRVKTDSAGNHNKNLAAEDQTSRAMLKNETVSDDSTKTKTKRVSFLRSGKRQFVVTERD